jgi:hypothetical protein
MEKEANKEILEKSSKKSTSGYFQVSTTLYNPKLYPQNE